MKKKYKTHAKDNKIKICITIIVKGVIKNYYKNSLSYKGKSLMVEQWLCLIRRTI